MALFYIHTFREEGKRVISICCLIAILSIAAYEDITSLKVSNRIICTGWCLGFLSNIFSTDLFTGSINWIKGIIIPICILFLLYIFKMLGAGDIKLISVIGGFFGSVFALKVFVVSIFIGGMWAVIKCVRYGYLYIRIIYFKKYLAEFIRSKKINPYYVRERDGDEIVIPFSAAIFAGYVIVEFIF